MSELMEALLFASFFATPRHLYVGGGETTPDAGSTAHLALYAASAFVIICTLIYKLVSSLSWLNPPAARGPHREAAATAAERRAASQLATAHRPPEAHTSERRRLRWRSGERLHNRRRPTTAKQPWSPRMPMPARLNTHQSRPPHDHRRDSSSTQAPNSPTHHQLPRRARSTTAPPPLSPPPLATGRKAGGTLGWSTSQSPNASASAHKKTTAVRREGRVSLLLSHPRAGHGPHIKHAHSSGGVYRGSLVYAH